jgi:hypothetical protein
MKGIEMEELLCQHVNDDGSKCFRVAIVKRSFGDGCFVYLCDLHRQEAAQQITPADSGSAQPFDLTADVSSIPGSPFVF